MLLYGKGTQRAAQPAREVVYRSVNNWHFPGHASRLAFLVMAATDQQLADAARNSLLRILETDTSSWSEGQRQQQQLQISELQKTISEFEAKAARSGRRLFFPVTKVNV